MNKLIEEKYANYTKQNNQWIDLARQAYLAKIESENASKRYKVLKANLDELSGYQNAIGGGYIITAVERSGSVDYKDIPELQGMDLDQYRRASSMTYVLKKV